MPPRTFRNALLNVLSAADREMISTSLELVTLAHGETLIEPKQAIPYVHFFETGFAAARMKADKKDQVETAMIGQEGLSGITVALGGIASAFQVVVQNAGTAYRISSQNFRALCSASPTFHGLILRYVQVLMVQTAESARANARFTIPERTARWLLMAHDRTDGDHIQLTHDALARALGVRRPGVTVATHVLEGSGLIKARRKHIEIRDRVGLEALASDCYGLPEAEHQRLIVQYASQSALRPARARLSSAGA